MTFPYSISAYDGLLTDHILSLLLKADPNEQLVTQYYPTCSKLICSVDNAVVGIALLYRKALNVEIKNLSVTKKYQNQGIASRLIELSKEKARAMGANSISIATGNSSTKQLALYQKCGFDIESIEKNFFEHYPQPIFENGIQCLDLIRLRYVL